MFAISFLFLLPSYNLPIRAHRIGNFAFNSFVLAERKAIAHKCLLKEPPLLAALDHVNDSFSEDLVGLPRSGSATSQSRLSSLKTKTEILTKT